MLNHLTRILLGILLAILLVPTAAQADMCVYSEGVSPQSTILVKLNDKTVAISYGPGLTEGFLLARLKTMNVSKLDLWIIESADVGDAESIENVLSSLDVQRVWARQSVKDNLALANLFSQKNITVDTASTQSKYSMGVANVALEGNSAQLTTVRIDYGSTGFVFFSSPEAAKSSALLNSTDVMYFANADQGGVVSFNNLQPAIAVLDGASLSAASPGELADGLIDNGVSVLINAGSPFSLSTDGTLVRLVDITVNGIIKKSKVNARSSPSVDSSRVAGLAKNTAVVITGLTAGLGSEKWYQINLEGRIAYVRGDLLTPVSLEKLQQLASQVNNSNAKKTPKPTVDTVSGATKKGH